MERGSHYFEHNTANAELRTKIVMILTGGMMTLEILAGTIFNSLALLADGWHMSTHLFAFLIAVIAYRLARKHRDNGRFSFGTGKIGVLGGFASSIILLVVAGMMMVESVERLMIQRTIQFSEALIVAAVGLAVNIASAVILGGGHNPIHSHGRTHDLGGQESDHRHDKNLMAAYVHVITDAFTSVTAIVALVIGYFTGIVWVDSVMGFLGGAMIILWAVGMIKDTALILVDCLPKTSDLTEQIRASIEALPASEIVDLHVWQVAAGKYAAIVAVEAEEPLTVKEYNRLIDVHEELVHINIQVSKKEGNFKIPF